MESQYGPTKNRRNHGPNHFSVVNRDHITASHNNSEEWDGKQIQCSPNNCKNPRQLPTKVGDRGRLFSKEYKTCWNENEDKR